MEVGGLNLDCLRYSPLQHESVQICNLSYPISKGKIGELSGCSLLVDSGIKVGEMERDCLLSHGISQFLKEKFFESSDGATARGLHTVIICKTCGLYAQANRATNDYRCRHPDCINKTNKYAEVYMPYSAKLFIQELMSMCIAPRIFTEEPSV